TVFNEHHGNYGVPRVSVVVRKLCATQGLPQPNHKCIQRLMRELGLNSSRYRQRTRKYDSSKGPRGKTVKNQLRRRNTSDRLYQKLV
ncbi:IS3 family transposase, partial [Furfurilactobacillus entadae]|uniref:IS3 family transposase n=1 Tax=Furfurilactobacillus entadae TaxID=2922307 RepID=UPI0038B3C6E2